MTRIVGAFERIAHEPTQTAGDGLDLTVAAIEEIGAPGRVDFGGGELEPPETTPHESQFRNPDDDYARWHLDAGQYLLSYNESLVAGARATVQTRDELLARGAFHPTLEVASLDAVPLSVGEAGLRVKENARVSTVVDVEGV